MIYGKPDIARIFVLKGSYKSSEASLRPSENQAA